MGLAYRGTIEVVTGPMFAGKTEALLSVIEGRGREGRRLEVFHPAADTRVPRGRIVSHTGRFANAQPFSDPQELLEAQAYVSGMVVIDEAQFAGSGLPMVAAALRRRGVRVFCAGLDRDFLGRPFEDMPSLFATADTVRYLTATCSCGRAASLTQRIDASGAVVLAGATLAVGGAECYAARCDSCFVRSISPSPQLMGAA